MVPQNAYQSISTLLKLSPIALVLRQFYRVCFLTAASANGLLAQLGNRSLPFDSLLEEYGDTPENRDALTVWLEVGVKLGELKLDSSGYSLKGLLAKLLARPESDALAAAVVESGLLYYRLIIETPERLKTGKLFTLSEQDSRLIARTSRILEPFISGFVKKSIPRTGPVRLLEVGCGSGIYIRYATEHNPQLTAHGLELQTGAAELARSNIAKWGLSSRVTIEQQDVRDRKPTPEFDVVTLHNNINYFPVEKRIELFKHLKGFLKPGGTLLLTIGCLEGSLFTELLNLWAVMTEGAGRLPAVGELLSQMQAAGFSSVRAERLVPGESFHGFIGKA